MNINMKNLKNKTCINLYGASLVSALIISVIILLLLYIFKISPLKIIQEYRNIFYWIVLVFCGFIFFDIALSNILRKSKIVQDFNSSISDIANKVDDIDEEDIEDFYFSPTISEEIFKVSLWNILFWLINTYITSSKFVNLIATVKFRNLIILILLLTWLTTFIYVIWKLYNITVFLTVIHMVNKKDS